MGVGVLMEGKIKLVAPTRLELILFDFHAAVN